MPARTAPAKVNLGLHVLRRRADGFHDLATVFVPIGWADRLSAAPAPELSLTTDDPGLPADGSNLVVRAALALRHWAGDAGLGATLHLEKHVPYGAGLGGGSSDAAAALGLLADVWRLDVPEPDLRTLALGLGSDVPFFLDGVAAYGTGRGERLAPVADATGRPYRCPFWLVVAVPPVHVSTADAFALVTPSDQDRPDLAAAVASNDLGRWRAEVTNDFQPSVEAAVPEVRETREALEGAGAAHAVLSGTGSAVVGVFERGAGARAAVESLQDARPGRPRVWLEIPSSV
ncbi:4-(cytidine 5'-diphospho)-2-C-methyl-D-erythritol kinase [Rubrivirga sp.]|uniref:4-(cytidine 5'-diphospho)-2-C-methyl-D-erythritol kinase n=1 Tax=Rubrivirga sp. TaxID=1885344 RepID=UPI003B52AA3D